MIENQTVRLRPWHDSDVTTLTALRNDPEIQAQLLARPRGSSGERVRRWLQERSDRPDGLLFVIADPASDQALGYLQIGDVDPFDRCGELGICLTREASGRGLCGEAIGLVAGYLRRTWNLRKLVLKVREDNERAIRCYERRGFSRCGVMREHVYADGAWRNLLWMELFLRADL